MKKTIVLAAAAFASVLAGTTQASAQESGELTTVYRWLNAEDNDYVTVGEHEFQEGQLLAWNWKNKTPLFVAYRNPGEGRVAVNHWWNPVTKDHISVAEDEFTDDQMMKMGYTDKRTQFYALTRRGPNTVAVYRWAKGDDWVNVPEEGNTDAYIKKSYKRKTFQFFAIVRASDAVIYDQL